MITTSKSQTTSRSHERNDWSFLPTLLSGMTGVGIGIMIGNYLGWL